MAKMKVPSMLDIGADLTVGEAAGTKPPKDDSSIVLDEHTIETNRRKREILAKIDNLEKKIKKHELKEGMLDKIISGTYMELEEVKPNEFTRRGQKQTVLIKQLEALSILHDTLMKYEDMIQKYHKILLDIENNKLNSYVKLESLKHEEKTTEEGISQLMQAVQEQLKGQLDQGSSVNPMLEDIQRELEDNNY